MIGPFREIPAGFFFEDDQVAVFFGKKDSSLENLKNLFPEYRWARIKQTHSDLVLESSASTEVLREGDAHLTLEKNLALLISTADCVPALLADSQTGMIAAIHAGWRGIASRILVKTAEVFSNAGSQNQNLRAWVGPHIQQSSFEVSEDVEQQLLASVKNPNPRLAQQTTPGKSLVDLHALALRQLMEGGVSLASIIDLPLDTKTDPRMHSHRRDQAQAGRQLSFILRK